MSGSYQPNSFLPPQPQLDPTQLAGMPPNVLAPAIQATGQTIGGYIADERAKSVAMGLLDPRTGLPTPAGAQRAAGQYANQILTSTGTPINVLMGSGGAMQLASPALQRASKMIPHPDMPTQFRSSDDAHSYANRSGLKDFEVRHGFNGYEVHVPQPGD